jgi:hypothetical protein
MPTARILDRELGLKERLATALELGQLGRDTPLARSQQADALAHVHQLDLARDLPWKIPRRALAVAAGLLVFAILLLVLPNPQDAVLQQRAAIRQAAEEQAEQLETLAEEIASLEGMSPEEREELARQLREAAEELRKNPGDAEEAVADVEAAREALRQQMEKLEDRQEAVDEMESFLRELADALGQESPDALEAARAGLENLPDFLQRLSEEEIAELALQMQELARRAAADPELAQSLEDLGEALRSQNPEALAQAAEAVADALERAEAEIAEQAAVGTTLEEALEALSSGGEELAEAGGGSAGEGAGEQGNGQGSQGESGTEGAGSGEEGSGTGDGWHTDPNQPNEGEPGPTDEEVYVPLGPDGKPAYVPGDPAEGGDDVTVLPSLDPEAGEDGVAVPYEAVYRYYEEAAGQAMERAYIPSGLREYVRSYFSGLEP